MFEVILSPDARMFFKDCDPPLARKLERCFSQLESDPFRHGNIKRLTRDLVGRFRFRVGDWRVIYRVDRSIGQVHVLVVAHRREVYEQLTGSL